MVVQHNMQAANASRMLNVVTGQQSKTTEKLASGYKINRAADDAAGLSISEKMRKQIRGLDQASTNAQDGVSAVQTAEGALTEVHSMLQRMNELAVQASNGTNSETDRKSIQDEISQLTTEIDRVAETTKFNEAYLLKGDADGTAKSLGINAHDAGLAGKLTNAGTGRATFEAKTLNVGDTVSIAGKEYTIAEEEDKAKYIEKATITAAKGDTVVKADGTVGTYDGSNWKDADGGAVAAPDKGDIYNGKTVFDYSGATAETVSAIQTAIKALGDGKTVEITPDGGTKSTYTVGGLASATNKDRNAIADLVAHGAKVKVDSTEYFAVGDNDNDDSTISVADAWSKMATELKTASDIGTDKTTQSTVLNNNNGSFTIYEGKVATTKELNFNLHVGADADMTNKINIDIDSMTSASLGIKDLNVKDDTGNAATYAIDAISDALAKVSATRSALGAVQNRLEHTIDNVDNVVENSTAAESRIRDTDMADEMVKFSKNNILAQAGQSMLAQANQSTQGVLSILG